MDVAIVGAGIGGLATALALQSAGIPSRLYESAAAPSEQGAGIQLGPNATRLLARVGVLDATRARATLPAAITLYDALRGNPVARLPLDATATTRYGAPYLHVLRRDLHGALLDAVRARGIAVFHGSHVEAVDEHDNGVELTLRGSGRHTAALCIGADGIHSMVRQHVSGDDAARFTGQLAYRALLPATAVAPRWRDPGASVWMAPGAHLVHYPVGAGTQINLVAVIEQSHWREERWDAPAQPLDLLARLTEWHETPRALWHAVTECQQWALFDRPPRRPWATARCALLGDACHAMLPFLAQGAAMAIEDGFALAAALQRWASDGTPARALADYEAARFERTARVHAAGWAQGRRFHLRAPLARALRNRVLGFGSRVTPRLAQRTFDWLYGFDATAVSSPSRGR